MTEQRMIEERQEKAARFVELGQNPYDNQFKPGITTQEFQAKYADKTREELAGSTEEYPMAGRIMAVRVLGKAAFYRIQDSTGQLQLFMSGDALGASYEQLKLL